MWYSLLIAVLAAYLLGNLNGAVCISAIMSGDDVRKHGSGNAGLTNFIRNYGVNNAMLVILVDAGKAVIACLVGGLLLKPYGMGTEGAAIGGFCVMLGHVAPALLGFKGGKGILSGLFVALVHFGICGAYILCRGCIKMQKSTTPRQGVVPSYR